MSVEAESAETTPWIAESDSNANGTSDTRFLTDADTVFAPDAGTAASPDAAAKKATPDAGNGAGLPRCPTHNALLLRYGGRTWCRFCETNRYRSLRYLRAFLYLCQWGIVLSLPVLAVCLALLAPTGRVPAAGRHAAASLSRDHYLWLVVPAAFLTASVATAIGRTTLRLLRMARKTAIDLVHWYEPLHALRDWIVISLFVAVPYAIALRWLPPANNLLVFLMERLPVLFLWAVIVMFLLDWLKWVTPGAVVPRVGKRDALLLYGFLIAGGFLFAQGLLSELARARSDLWPLYIAIGLTLFFSLLYIVVWIAARFTVGPNETARLPVPATIAMVGPSNVGKTVFVARAYQLMENVLGGHLSLEPTERTRDSLNPILRRLEEDRQWPRPTDRREISRLPFCMKDGMEELVRFHWMDLPGAAFTAPDLYTEARRAFDNHLENSDAVAMLVDARDLDKVSDYTEISYARIYREVAEKLYRRLKEIGPGARPVPLAIVLTQCDRVDPKHHAGLESKVRTLAEHWRYLAKQAGLPRPEIRVFLTSAVRLPFSKDRPGNPLPPRGEPLLAQNAREPVLWLAGKVLRTHVGPIESAAGFSVGSEIQRAVVRLETLSR